AIRVARQCAFDAVPRVAHGVLCLFPAHARLALGALPVAAEVGLELVVPLAAGVRAARVRAVAVRRAIVAVVVVIGLVVVGVAMLVAIVAVGRLVGPVGAVAAIECIAHRFLRLLPGQLRLFLGVLPSGADFAFQRIVPAAPGVLFAHGVAVGVGRRVVVVAVLAVDVGPVLVFAAPVLGFARRVD